MKYLSGNKVSDIKIAYIGGGSRGWAWGLMSDLVSCDDISGDVYLYDIDFENQDCNEEYRANLENIAKEQGAEVYYVELIAPQAVRLQRNETENRLRHKASKRDLEISRGRLLRADDRYRCVSMPGEIPFENYLRIDNTDISAEDAAVMIQQHFGL